MTPREEAFKALDGRAQRAEQLVREAGEIMVDLIEALRTIAASPVRDNGIHDGTGRTVYEVAKTAILRAKK